MWPGPPTTTPLDGPSRAPRASSIQCCGPRPRWSPASRSATADCCCGGIPARRWRRRLSARRAREDEPGLLVRLDEPRAVVLGTLLGGLDVTVDTTGQGSPPRGAGVETLTVPAGSPAVGRRLADLDLPDPASARVLAVIRDDTPELLEDDPDRPVQPGDRLVLVGRPGPRAALRAHLGG